MRKLLICMSFISLILTGCSYENEDSVTDLENNQKRFSIENETLYTTGHLTIQYSPGVTLLEKEEARHRNYSYDIIDITPSYCDDEEYWEISYYSSERPGPVASTTNNEDPDRNLPIIQNVSFGMFICSPF